MFAQPRRTKSSSVTFRIRAANDGKASPPMTFSTQDRGGIFSTRGVHADLLVRARAAL